MGSMKSTRTLLTAALAVTTLAGVSAAAAPAVAPIPAPNYPAAATSRDGSKDWAFEYGTWRTHYRILAKRLVHSHDWYDCYGTSIVQPFWGTAGNLEDGDLKCPHRYIGGMTLRMYNPRSHQWTLWWATQELGVSPPPQVGHFDANGVGRFYAYDTWRGTPIINRYRWTKVNGNPRFEQAVSTDGGKTWETNWTTDYVRVPSLAKGVWNRAGDTKVGHAGFDFLVGKWHLSIKRLLHPLSGSHDWISCSGPSIVHPFWAGAADFQEGAIHCPGQQINALTLRLYHASTGQWLSYWATQKNGLGTGLPIMGRFDAVGHGELTGPDTWLGKPIVTRTIWTMRRGNPHLEQAFSADGGKTWETNWVTDYTRA